VGARGWVAWGLAAALALEPATAAASAAIATTGALVAPDVPHALFKKKKKKKKKKKAASGPAKIGPEVSVESANTKREAIRAAAKPDADAGNFADAAKTLEDNGAILGDPVVFLEAADLRLKAAEKDRDIDQAEMAIASSRVAGDIAGYYEAVAAGSVESAWLVIDPSTAGELSSRADDTVARAESLIEEIEAEKENDGAAVASGPTDKPKRERKKRGKAGPGTGLIAAGSGMLVVGAAGVSMAIAGLVISRRKQDEVEKLTLPMDQAEVDELDKEGNRANSLAIAGAVVAAVGVGVGIPLVVIGVKRRKEAKNAPASASLRLVPRLSRSSAGLAISGRF
jgi:hypothetical protein